MRACGQYDSYLHHLVQDKGHHLRREDGGCEVVFSFLYAPEWCVAIPRLPVLVLTSGFRHRLLPVSAFP